MRSSRDPLNVPRTMGGELGILAVLIGIPLGLWLNTLVAQALSSSVDGPPNIQIDVN